MASGSATSATSGLSPAGLTSPYLNFNPAYIAPSPESQYIFPEGANHQGRGRFELMFSTIGGFTAVGGAIGGVGGIYAGIKATEGLSGPAKKTQMLNFVVKRGASWGQMCGVVALMYSGIGTILSYARGHDDELNTVAAGTMSGLLFKSTAGLRGCLKGGALGLGVTSAYVLYTSSERVMHMIGRS